MPATVRRNWLFGFAAVALLILVIEVILRFAVNLSVDYLSRREDVNYEFRLWQMHLFNNFMGMHEPDGELFWKLKPNYRSRFITVNADGLAGPEIAPKAAGALRILFLGDSTPLGLGLPNTEDSFVRQLETILRRQLPERPVTVINAAVAGYSSWQCLRQLELLGDRLQPDLVIAYVGNNDPSINGYLSDRELYAQTRYSGWLNRFLGNFYSYQLLKGIVLRVKAQPMEGKVLKPRVTPEENRENLAAIAEWCAHHKSGLLICAPATPDLWPPGIQFKVFARGQDAEGRLVMAEEMQQRLAGAWALCLDTLLLPGRSDQWTQQVYRLGEVAVDAAGERLPDDSSDPRAWNNHGVAAWRNGLPATADFERAIVLDSLNPIPHYNLGVALYRSDPTRAREQLRRAKELDNFSLRIKPLYVQNYRDFCRDRTLPLADIDSLLRDLPENEYFVDHCHPTIRGHELIAAYLAELVSAWCKRL